MDVTDSKWNACNDPAAMLRLLRDRGLIDARKARLFGAACCRRHWGLLPDQARRVVEAVERHADGLASEEDLATARSPFRAGLGEASGPASFAGVAVSYLMGEARHEPFRYATDILPWVAQAGENLAAETAAQAGILRCIFGSPPFGPVKIRPEWLAFSDGIVARLAQAIEQEQAFERMPVLADSLLDAGCCDEVLLGHLRGPGPHARGCHVLDGLLNGPGAQLAIPNASRRPT